MSSSDRLRVRRPSASLAATAFLAAACLAGPALAAGPVDLDRAAFVGVDVVDVDAGRLQKGRTVSVEDGRIAAIEPAEVAEVPEDVVVIEGRGRTLIPGLADLHVHHTASGAFPEPGAPPLFDEADLALYLVHGITTVRNMAGTPTDPLLAARARSGRLLAPRFWASGPPIVTANSVRAVTDADSARKEVRRLARAGFDFVKVYCCFGPSARASWDALVAAASEAGMPVVGHVPRDLPISEAARLASIEHLEDLPRLVADGSEEARRARLDELARSGVFVTPTLVPFESRGLSDPETRAAFLESAEASYVSSSLWRRELAALDDGSSWYLRPDEEARTARLLPDMMAFVRDLREHGVPLLAGSDSGAILGVVPGFGLHRELELLVEAGLDPAEALRSATLEAARFLGVDDVRGRIAVGTDADLVLLEENPLENVSATRTVVGVMIGRTWLGEEALGSLRESLRKR